MSRRGGWWPAGEGRTWEELLGGGGDLGLLGDAVGLVSRARAAGGAEARNFPYPLRERGKVQRLQHVHWVWGGGGR